MNWSFVWIALTFGISSVCFAAEPSLLGSKRTTVSVFYGQSRDVWGTLHDVKSAQGDLESINEILQRKYGTYEEALSTVKVRVDGINGFESSKLLEKIWIEVGTEADAFGLVRNPVVPELHANAILAGAASVGFQGQESTTGFHTRLGLIGGSGYEKRIDAFSTDLIDKLPIRSGHLYFFGLSQDFAKTFTPSDWKIKPRLSAHEIEFKTAVSPSSLDVVEGTSYFAFRWKGQMDATHPIPALGQTQAGIVAVAGPQPIPVDILPDVWDYSHRMQSFPEIGSMLGAGLRMDKSWSQSASWRNTAGFFGGYWGGESSLHLGAFRANVGTWGIETSSAYRTLGQRIWTASLGMAF
ncbi:MAG: hypothetical protein ACJ763_17160 [Bdellovibrionia bacterium]